MATTESAPSPHLLVVDDDLDLIEPLIDFLKQQRERYRVSMVDNGRAAIDFMRDAIATERAPVDLVLLDMRMPGLSGLDVLGWIREQPQLRLTRVLILTANNNPREKVAALSGGADDYITKPYEYRELLARVRTNLRTMELEKQLRAQGQRLARLNSVSREIAADLEMHKLLSASARGMLAVLPVARAAIFLRSTTGDLLTCWVLAEKAGVLSGADAAERQTPIPVGAGLIGQTCGAGGVSVLNEGENHPHFLPTYDSPAGGRVTSMMAVSLMRGARCVGAVVAWNISRGAFSDFDAYLLNSLANVVSQSLENAGLVQRLQLRQQELLESRNRLQAVIDGILQPIYTVDEKWRLVAVNKVKADELGCSPNELTGRLCYQTFFNRDHPCDHCQVAATLKKRTPSSWSVRWLGSDHLPQEWAVNAYPLPRSKMALVQAVVVWLDRTDERRLENSLMQAGKLAAIGQLAAGVAHEINNPLTVIKANAEMLNMGIEDESEAGEMIDLIGRASERAAKVVQGLLNFARQERYEFDLLDINESVRQAFELVVYPLQANDIEVIQDLASDIPLIQASNEHLKSVWINLLVNAGDALKEKAGPRQIKVITRLTAAGEQVQVTVQDNGTGMSPAQLAHIFEPFYTTKDPDKGTGLGLATCYRIIQQHRGEIDVVSDVGAGTTFIVLLPVNRPVFLEET